VNTDKPILPSDPDAATYRTDIRGWVSRDGRYFGDDTGAERTARYAGSTHDACKVCGAIVKRPYTLCDVHKLAAEIDRYNALPAAAWDGLSMLYSEDLDEFFHSIDDAEQQADDELKTLGELRLLICRPIYATIDSSQFAYDLPDDGDLPIDVEAAIEAFNLTVGSIPISWSPTRVRLLIDRSEDKP
jgi:hypothetical protein